MAFEYRILGSFAVRVGTADLSLGSHQQQALLALLVLHRNQVVSADELIDRLWGESPPPTARNTLQTYVSRLRRVLATDGAEALETVGSGYRLRIGPDQLDAERFARLAAAGRDALDGDRPDAAAGILRQALDEWRGPALADFRYDAFAEADIDRLEQLRRRAFEDRVDADLRLARHATVIDELESAVADDPLRERSWELLLLALHRSGRSGEALRAFERAERILRDELDVEPSARLYQLAERIHEDDPSLQLPPAADVAPLRELPIQPTSFVGRETELADVARLVRPGRLLTLVGAGGAGKTRLALEASTRIVAGYHDGARFVDLAGVPNEAAVPHTVAAELGIRGQPDRPLINVVAGSLRQRELLLIVDNCEHVLDALAPLVGAILAAGPGVAILATSRAPLAIAGETVLEVTPLPVPEDADTPLEQLALQPAVRLLLDRAAAAAPGFEVDPDDAATVARICRRLDGLPLAIELAATRVRLLSLRQLEQRLSDRFALLESGPRLASARHETLRATIDWSYELLGADEQRLLDRLAVFSGGFCLDEVEAVCGGDGIEAGDLLGLLGRLVDRSLVVAHRRASLPVRYALLETIRAYAGERLAERPEAQAVRANHARHFLQLAETGERELRGPGQRAWLERLRLEEANVHGALAWSIAQAESDIALRLVVALLAYWQVEGYPADGLRWMEAALAISQGSPGLHAAGAHTAAGFLAVDIGEHDRATRHAEEGLRLLGQDGDEATRAWATHLRGAIAMFRGDYHAAEPLLETAAEAFRATDRPWHLARVLHHGGMLNRFLGDYEQAEAFHLESLRLYGEVGDELRGAYASWQLAVVARYRGDLDAAERRCVESAVVLAGFSDASGIAHVETTLADAYRLAGELPRAEAAYERCLAEFSRDGDRRCEASVRSSLGDLARRRGDDVAARRHYLESLAIRREIGDQAGVAESLEGLAAVAADHGGAEPAAVLLGASSAIRTALGATVAEVDRTTVAATEATAQLCLGIDACCAARERGMAMTPDAAIALAIDAGAAGQP